MHSITRLTCRLRAV